MVTITVNGLIEVNKVSMICNRRAAFTTRVASVLVTRECLASSYDISLTVGLCQECYTTEPKLSSIYAMAKLHNSGSMRIVISTQSRIVVGAWIELDAFNNFTQCKFDSIDVLCVLITALCSK